MIKSENKYFIFDKPQQGGIIGLLKNIKYRTLSVYYKLLLKTVKPHGNVKKKYDVSLCAIFKNEAPYLKEWIEFHRIVGIDKFYLYNNFSSDNYIEVLQPYIESGIVDLIEWPIKQGQMKAYDDCFKKHREDTKWIGFLDLDEFVVPNKVDKVYDFLKKFENKRPSVIIYWKVFGTSGLINRDKKGLVTEEIVGCWEKYDTVGKCFFNTRYDYDQSLKNNIDMHSIWGSYNKFKLPPVNFCDKVCLGWLNPVNTHDFPIQINHYFTKSYNEYLVKQSRGDAFFEINPRDEEYFYRHEMLCNAKEYKIHKYLIKLKLNMKINK